MFSLTDNLGREIDYSKTPNGLHVDPPSDSPLIVKREVTETRNQCWRCRWFAPWTELIGGVMRYTQVIDADDYSQWKYNEVPLVETVWRFYQHRKDCGSYEVTEATRNKPRCPECGHGNPNGHGRGRCIATVSYGRDWETGYENGGECGCTYRGHE